MSYPSGRAESVDIREKVAFLSSPAVYPHHPARVDVKETHMSWVFLAADIVYKMKKPVKSGVLDFSTLEAREANCRAEVSLNVDGQLAPSIYLGMVPLTLEDDSALALDGDGRVVDWLVRMRRLPADRTLDHAILHGTVTRAEIETVAALLSAFYQRAPPADLSPADYIARFVREQAQNRAILTMPRFDLPGPLLQGALGAVERFIAEQGGLLAERVEMGSIVEGHGDLKPEHMYLLDPPVVIDRLEFNRRLRLVDPFDELALLALECELLGARWVGEQVVAQCADALDGKPSDPVMSFYTAYRAVLRARLTIGHLLDCDPREPEKWVPLACRYLAMAERASITMYPREARR